MTQHQNPPTMSPEAQVNPKAAAKAAKAYAKATRPWYKKKRFMVPLAFVVIAGISAGAGGGSEDEGGPALVESDTAAASTGDTGAAKQKAAKKDEAAKPGTEGNPVEVGQTVELEGTRYTVKSAKTAKTVGGEFFQEKANGVYVIVSLTIENTKDESKVFWDEAAKFVAKDDTSYTTDSDATIAGTADGEEALFLTEMHPDLPVSGRLIFDVPQGKAKGGVLEVGDLFGNGEAYINLGLK